MAAMFAWKPNDCRDAMRLLRTKNGVNVVRINGEMWRVHG
jgi:hypothetical protein